MIRLLLSILCALGLAFAPVAVTAAPAPTSDMAGCVMGGEMPDMPPDHSKMDCCTPACHAPAAAAILPNLGAAEVAPLAHPGLTWAPAKELASLTRSGLDPPPRA